MKLRDLYWPSLVFVAVFLFAFGFAVTVAADQDPPHGICCHEMCEGSLTDTSHFGYILNGQCVNGPGPDDCDYRAFLCKWIYSSPDKHN